MVAGAVAGAVNAAGARSEALQSLKALTDQARVVTKPIGDDEVDGGSAA